MVHAIPFRIDCLYSKVGVILRLLKWFVFISPDLSGLDRSYAGMSSIKGNS